MFFGTQVQTNEIHKRNHLKFASLAAWTLVFILQIYNFKFYFVNDPILFRDDIALIEPVTQINTLVEYFDAVIKNDILDLQPIRDLSFKVNYYLKSHYHFLNFHIFNFVFFIITVALFIRLLKVLEFSNVLVVWFSMILFVHPLMLSSVGWISARKHSLALIFILMSLIDLTRYKRLRISGVIYFFLSTLCHQIFCLYPLWVLAYSKLKRININKWLFVLMLVSSWMIVGLAWYKTFYINLHEVSYTDGESLFFVLSRFILSIGRSVSLVIFPVVIAVYYDQGSIINLIGLGVGVIVLYVFFKSKMREEIFSWLFLAFLSIAPTYIAFVNDTYLYLSLICFLIALASFIKSLDFSDRMLSFMAFFIVLSFASKTTQSSVMWRSNLDLWEYSYNQDPNPKNAISFGGHLEPVDQKRALELVVWSIKNLDISQKKNYQGFFHLFVHKSKMTIKQKLKVLRYCYEKSDLYDLSLALTLIRSGDTGEVDEAITLLKDVFSRESKYKKMHYEYNFIDSIKSACKIGGLNERVCKELGLFKKLPLRQE